MKCGLGLVCMVTTPVSRDTYLGGRDGGGVGVSLVKGLPGGDDMAMDDRLDTVLGNLRLKTTRETMDRKG